MLLLPLNSRQEARVMGLQATQYSLSTTQLARSKVTSLISAQMAQRITKLERLRRRIYHLRA